MSKVIIVGTLAFDSIETPHGNAINILGGSAPYASLAALTVDIKCAIISIIGNDFTENYLDIFRSRSIDISEVQIDNSGKSFFWSGKYRKDMKTRDTLETQVNVLSKFNPNIPKDFDDANILVLGNLDPKVQLDVINKKFKKTRFIVLDTMNFWMNHSIKDLKKVISKADLICINDEEVMQLSHSNDLQQAVEKILKMGPKYLIMKNGEKGAILFSNNNKFKCSSYPVKKVIDPTGAGDSFAGALAGYLAKEKNINFPSISSAIIYANGVASFCVEKFGVENMLEINKKELEERINFIKNHNI
ncbi:MAG: sugar kinase [Bacteroidetes bacterium MED-G13]|nr:MAG: sugar kinase [Bacteroidetes bacterium MED-G13]